MALIRFSHDPVTRGPCAGLTCNRAAWDEMLERSRTPHGRDVATSLQTEEVALTGVALLDGYPDNGGVRAEVSVVT